MLVSDAESTSSAGVDMAWPPPKRSSRYGAGDAGAGRPQGRSAERGRGLTTRGPAAVDGDDPDRCSDDDLEVEDDDDLREDAAAFDIELGATIDVDVEDADADDTPTKTGKNKSEIWKYFTEVKEGSIRVSAICKHTVVLTTLLFLLMALAI
jgi:hypothetical protein